MINIRIPSNTQVPTKFFAQFTARDLIRIGLPVAVAVIAASGTPAVQLASVAAAAAVGAVLYLYRPYGKPLDVHAVNAAQWYVAKDRLDGSDVTGQEFGTRTVTTSSGYVAAFIKVTPTNLSLKTEDEQAALHSIYQDLLEQISYPIKIHSRQEIADSHLEYGSDIAAKDVTPSELQEDYLQYWSDVCSNQPTVTQHYISVRIPLKEGASGWLASLLGDQGEGYSPDNAPREVARRAREITDQLNTASLSAESLAGDQLVEVAQFFDDDEPQLSARHTSTTEYSSDAVQKRQAAEGPWRKTYVLTDFPSTQPLGWPTDLLQTHGPVEVTQVIRPTDTSDAVSTLTRTIEKVSAEISSWLRAGHLGTNDLEATQDDADWMLDRLTSREDKPFTYRCYVTVHGRTVHECEQNADRMENTLDTIQIGYEEPVYRTHTVFKAVSPFHPDPHVDGYLMPGSSVAAGFPFSTQVPQNTTGVVFGEGSTENQPVVLDRFAWSSHSMARMGMVGSGKSYASKLELMRSWIAYDDLQLIVVDPKQEYGDIVRTLGPSNGTIQHISEDASYRFDDDTLCFQVEDRGQRDDVDRLVDLVEEIYQVTSQDRRKTIVLIDEARLLLNDEDGRRVLNRFVLEARDTNTSVTLVTQNASHFTHSREGREILDNMPAKIFMRHDRVPDSVVEYFDMSSREKQELFKLRTGTDAPYSECLVRVSDHVEATARVQATATEHSIITAEDGDSL